MRIPNLLEIEKALVLGKEEGHLSGNIFSILEDRASVERFLAEHTEECQYMKNMAEQPFLLESLTYRLYKQFDTDGKRQAYEQVYFARRDRMKLLMICGYLYQESKYYEELQDVIWEICEEYTWCLPAHLGETSLIYLPEPSVVSVINGKILPYSYSHKHRLDLFACETAKELAETLRIVGDAISENIRDRVVAEIVDRVFTQYLVFNGTHGFETDVSNWSAVCGASIGIATLYLIDDETLLAPVLQRVISDLDVFVGSYGEDGIGREGVEYWEFGFLNFCMFADLLKERTGKRLDLFAEEKVKKIAYFPSKAYVFQNSCINFSDCENPCEIDRALLSYLKMQYPDMTMPTMCAAPKSNRTKKVISIRDIFWTKEWKAEAFTERTEFFEDTQWLISCQRISYGARSFVIKGGTNHEPHNHNDLGNFILMLNDEVFLCDLGRGLYTKDYFGEKRYTYLVNASRGHCVPIIDGKEQTEGESRRAKIQEVLLGKEKDFIALDLTDAYECKTLDCYTRSVEIEKQTAEIRIKDQFKMNTDFGEICERFISKICPDTLENEVFLHGKSACLHIVCKQPKADVLIQEESYQDFQGKMQRVYFIDFIRKREDFSEEMEISLKFETFK